MQEIWKDIKNYEGLYQVSNLGRVKSFPRTGTHQATEHILSQANGSKGYMLVVLQNKSRKTCRVHRLVAEAFIPNPNNLPQVDHIDDNKKNNCVSNLQWITNEDNMKKSWQTGARTLEKTYKRGKEHFRARAINQYDMQGNFIKTWCSISEAERQLNLKRSNIGYCCQNKKKSANGYKWEYVNAN